jgi:hypothetical protein
MPRKMPMEALQRNIESHSTLQLFVVTGATSRSYYFATAALQFNGVVWQPSLRRISEIRSSIQRAANQASLDLQNVDTNLGVELLAIRQFIFGAEAKVGRYWRDGDSGAEFHKVLLTGVVTGLEIGETAVRLTVVADCYSGVSVGPNRTVTRICQWAIHGAFKGPECGYVGPESVCNGLLNDAGGCEGRHGDPLKFAKFGGFPYLDNAVKFKII